MRGATWPPAPPPARLAPFARTPGRTPRRRRRRPRLGRRPAARRPSRPSARPTRACSGREAHRAATGRANRGLDEQTVRRHEADDVRRRLLAAPERESGDADHGAELEHRLGVVHWPAEGMDDHPGHRGPERTELREERVLGIALPGPRPAVQDRRLAGLDRERQVAAKVDELVGDRREDPVVVEARSRRSRRPGGGAPRPRSSPTRRRSPWQRRADGPRPRRRARPPARRGRARRPMTSRSSPERGSVRRPRRAPPPALRRRRRRTGRTGDGSGCRRGASAGRSRRGDAAGQPSLPL